MLFDYFGTLTRAVRQGPAHVRMARSLGCEPDEWLDLMARTFYQRASGRLGEPIDVLYDLARHLGARPGWRALRSVYAQRVGAIGADGPLRPDAVRVLRAVRRRGLRTAVVSDCWYELPRLLPRLSAHPLLDAHVYSVDVGSCKPHPAMYLAACERLGVRAAGLPVRRRRRQPGTDRRGGRGHVPVRLAAPDLAKHLTFGADDGFRGSRSPRCRNSCRSWTRAAGSAWRSARLGMRIGS